MLQNHRHWLCASSKNQIDGKGAVMKKILNVLWLFVKIDLMCYVIYFLSMLLLTLIFYHDVPAGYRDFTPIYWSMQVIFFFAYHLIYTRQINDEKLDLSRDEFSIKKTIISFFKTEYLQIILMSIISVVFEITMLSEPEPTNLMIAALAMLIPSALAITVPIARTLIACSISIASMLVSYILIHYKKHHYWNTSRKRSK